MKDSYYYFSNQKLAASIKSLREMNLLREKNVNIKIHQGGNR